MVTCHSRVSNPARWLIPAIIGFSGVALRHAIFIDRAEDPFLYTAPDMCSVSRHYAFVRPTFACPVKI